jgi:hypothetical protein
MLQFCNLCFEYIGVIYTALARIHVNQKKEEMNRPEQRKRNLKRSVQQCGIFDGFFAGEKSKKSLREVHLSVFDRFHLTFTASDSVLRLEFHCRKMHL